MLENLQTASTSLSVRALYIDCVNGLLQLSQLHSNVGEKVTLDDSKLFSQFEKWSKMLLTDDDYSGAYKHLSLHMEMQVEVFRSYSD